MYEKSRKFPASGMISFKQVYNKINIKQKRMKNVNRKL